MNNISGFVALAVLGGILIAVALYCLRGSIRALFRGRIYRDEQARNISHSRLAKMLTKKNIDLQHYHYDQPVVLIRKHMRKCKHCSSLEKCDYYLDHKDMDDAVDTPFCPNNDSIIKIKKQQEKICSRIS